MAHPADHAGDRLAETSQGMSWYCYILRCADDTLYCGISNDLGKRLEAHNSGTGAKYTRTRTPVEMVYHETCVDRSAASKRELAIKKLSRKKKLSLIATHKG